MSLTFNTVNPSNWELLASENLIAPTPPGEVNNLNRWYPIAPWDVPFLTAGKLIAIYAESESAEPHWKYAGQAIQKINTGLTVGTDHTGVLSVKKFYLNQFSLLKYLDNYGGEYSLTIKIPYWIREITVYLWEYVGDVVDSHEDLLNDIIDLVTA